MVRSGITKANMLLLRGTERAKSGLSKLLPAATENSGGISKSSGKMENSELWVPHPRTGIYFPKGHEWVMDDVPEDAARLSQTHWFRNIDGVDNPKYQT